MNQASCTYLVWSVLTCLRVLKAAVLCRVQKIGSSPQQGIKAISCVLASQNRRTGLRRKVLSEHCSAFSPGECLIPFWLCHTFQKHSSHWLYGLLSECPSLGVS